MTRSVLSISEERALARMSRERPTRAGEIGMAVAVDVPASRKPQHYARLGGKVAKSLVARGLARWVAGRHDWGWVRT